jgi:hypothetical protein
VLQGLSRGVAALTRRIERQQIGNAAPSKLRSADWDAHCRIPVEVDGLPQGPPLFGVT